MAAARSFLIILAIVVGAGCLGPTAPDAVVGTPFDLKVGATATLPDGLRIKFDRVTADSRCPSDVQCVRAGEAIIAVTMATSNGGPETREIRTDATGSQIPYADHTIHSRRWRHRRDRRSKSISGTTWPPLS